MRRITDILRKLAGPIQSVPAGAHVTIRPGGELWAAISLDDYHLIADPLRPTGELAFRLTERAREVRRADRSSDRGQAWHAAES